MVAAGTLAYLALRGGGYDAIVRGETGLVLWAVIAFGLLLRILPRGRIGRAEAIPLVAFAAFALFNVLSLAWTSSDERTYAEVARATMLGAFLVLPMLGLNRYTWRSAAAGITVAALGVSAFALATRLAPGSLPSDEVARLFDSDRLSYPFDYWNAVGAWAAMAATMGLAWSAHMKVLPLRALAAAATPAAIAALYLTYSRGAVIGATVGVISVLVLSRSRWTVVVHVLAVAAASTLVITVIRSEPAIADGTGGAGGAAVAAALAAAAIGCAAVGYVTGAAGLDRFRLPRRVALWATPAAILSVLAIGAIAGGFGALDRAREQFVNERTTTAALSSDPAERLSTAAGTRSDVWETALDAFADDPAGGLGPGTFEFYWSENAPVPEFLRDAHSLYLEQLAELGLPGLLLLLAALGSALALAIAAIRRARRSADVAAGVAMTAAGIVFLVEAGYDWMWELSAVSALGLASLGVALGGRLERTGRRRGVQSPAVLAGVAIAVVIAVTQIPGLTSTARLREAETAQAERRTGEASELAADAIDAQPWAASPYLQRAAVAAGEGDFAAARADAREAAEREPDNWRHWLGRAQIALAEGDRGAARRFYERLAELSRSAAVSYGSFAEIEVDQLLEQATKQGCLAYTFGDCAIRRRPVGPAVVSRCIDADPVAIATIETYRGGPIADARAVEASLNEAPVFYVAARVDGRIAVWVLNAAAYNGQTGSVIPLAGPAASLIPGAPEVDPGPFGISAGDDASETARECLAGEPG